jgi:hypothetical protein
VTQQWRAPLAFVPPVFRSAARRRHDPRDLDVHLRAAIDWLCRAQDQTSDGGVSYGYSARGGWKAPYRETTGYIIPTLYRAADALDDPQLAERALRAADWLTGVQNADGSFANPEYGNDGIVFDTGQDLFGLVRAFERSAEPRFLDAAVRAARWLVEVADANGRWTTHEHFGTPHAYNTRTAWALLLLDRVAPHDDHVRVARANLDWALDCQQSSGFFTNAAFVSGDNPYTHNISYTTCGLQESGWILGDDRYVVAARRCADAALGLLDDDGFLPGQITADGEAAARYACLTGLCQFAIVWAKWFEQSADATYQVASRRALRYVMSRHDLTTSNPAVRGAIAGSSPIWGRYAPLSYPNWAAKFFVDAALLQRSWGAS